VEEDPQVLMERIISMNINLNKAAYEFSNLEKDLEDLGKEIRNLQDNKDKLIYQLGIRQYSDKALSTLTKAERILGKVQNSHTTIKNELKSAQTKILRTETKRDHIPDEDV
jgi:hypothetical protein